MKKIVAMAREVRFTIVKDALLYSKDLQSVDR